MAINVIFLQPLIALIAGILILIIPRLLNYIVAIYLILVGLAGLLPHVSGWPAGDAGGERRVVVLVPRCAAAPQG